MDNQLIVVRQLPVIEEQMLTVRQKIEARVGEALALECTEDSIKAVKAARAELRAEYAELETRRKEVKASILAPYEHFEKIYKECAGDIYAQADAKLKGKIDTVEDGLRKMKRDALVSWFDEYRQSISLDPSIASFENSGIKVNLSSSEKSLRDAAKAYLDGIKNDLALIGTMEHPDEVMAEYSVCRNLAAAANTVSRRFKAIEAERLLRQAREAAEREREAAEREREARAAHTHEEADSDEYWSAPSEALQECVPTPDGEEPEDVPAVYTVQFKVIGTIEQLRALKAFLVDGGYEYEQ